MSKLVEELLTTARNPLVAITLTKEERRGVQSGRAMGTIIERIGNTNLRLVVTCRHTFYLFPPMPEILVMAQNPRPRRLQVIGRQMNDPAPESDMSFLIVRDPMNAPAEPFLMYDGNAYSPGSETRLFNAMNHGNPIPPEYKVFISRQPTRELELTVFCKLSEPTVELVSWSNAEKCGVLEKAGYQRMRALQMISRAGCSGSPIWDEELCLYGMNVRGSTQYDETHQKWGDVAAYIPATALFEACERVRPQIEERLKTLK